MATIKGDKTLSELAEQFAVHANQITQWRSQLLEGAVGVFGGEAKAESATAAVALKMLYEDRRADAGDYLLKHFHSYCGAPVSPKCSFS